LFDQYLRSPVHRTIIRNTLQWAIVGALGTVGLHPGLHQVSGCRQGFMHIMRWCRLLRHLPSRRRVLLFDATA
jgi:hypothetical protein